jgi:hypothetical protein
VTEEVATHFAALVESIRARESGHPPEEIARFVMKLMFCMFAEWVELLPDKVFGKLVRKLRSDPKRLAEQMKKLFDAMATGGDFGVETIEHFNGGLFNDPLVLMLDAKEINRLIDVVTKDWSNVEPSVFGTLFERTLDPDKRSQIGAHYTSKEDIKTLLEPVVMAPPRREWAEVKAECDALWEQLKGKKSAAPDSKRATACTQAVAKPAGTQHCLSTSSATASDEAEPRTLPTA